MITWAIDYWYLCLAALVIGVATAAWIWLRLGVSDDASADVDEPLHRATPPVPAAPLAPVKPVIDVAQPVTFTAPPAPEPVPATPVSDAPATAAPAAFVASPSAASPSAASPSAAADTTAAPRPAIAAAVGDPDDLTLIKGVGPKLNTLLISLGVTRFDQIAAWGEAEIAEVDGYLGTFRGRIARDSWVEQTGLLARGDTAGFAAKFGALGSENKG